MRTKLKLVRIAPGSTIFTFTPISAISKLKASEIPSTANFVPMVERAERERDFSADGRYIDDHACAVLPKDRQENFGGRQQAEDIRLELLELFDSFACDLARSSAILDPFLAATLDRETPARRFCHRDKSGPSHPVPKRLSVPVW